MCSAVLIFAGPYSNITTYQDLYMKVSIIRKAHFNAAHRLNVDSWSEEKNRATFGKCCSPNYHGHNYDLEVKVTGEVDPVTGMVIDLKVLKDIIKEHIEERFDHKNLNLDVDDFKDKQPSAENMAIVIYDLLRAELDEKLDLHIKLYETARNIVEYPVS